MALHGAGAGLLRPRPRGSPPRPLVTTGRPAAGAALAALLLAGVTAGTPILAQPASQPMRQEQAESSAVEPIAPTSTSPAIAALARQIAQLLAAPAVARAHWGIAVSTLDGRPIVAIDADKLFHPASNAKLFTTSAAMAMLGPNAAVATRIEARGPIAAGILSGNLALVGAGDANFATDDTPYQPPAPHHAATPRPDPPPPLRALEAMADAVVASGIRTITGDILGDDTRFAWEPYPDDWAADDLLWGYGAPVSALSLHDNQIALSIRAGTTTGAPATAEFEPGMPPWFTLDTTNLRTGPAKSGTHVQLGPIPGNPRALRLWGTVAQHAAAPPDSAVQPLASNAGPRPQPPDDIEQIALPDPALFAAEALRTLLLARGVTITGTARAQHRLPLATASLREQLHQPPPAASANRPTDPSLTTATGEAGTTPRVLASTLSPTLLDDETATNKLSQNLHAELLLYRLAADQLAPQPTSDRLDPRPPTTQPDPASRAQGLRVLRSILPLAGIDPDDVVLVDGSGLSTHDLVTPRAVVRLLTWAAAQPWSAAWRATLPIGGVDGTLAGRFTHPPLTGRVVAKTGTLGEARALSGYLTSASGRTLAFSILVDNHTPGSTADRDTADHLIALLYAAL